MTRLSRSFRWIGILLVIAACGGTSIDVSDVASLPPTSPDHITAMLAAAERPVVVNIWASWCIPCRSEAPLLERAHAEFGGDIRFVGVNVRDGQDGARQFIAEFGRESEHGVIEHLIDGPGQVPIALGGTSGVPQTFFFASGGELVHFHPGVIDERTLALQLDELRSRD